jgi:uncharacterized protein
VHDGVTVSGVGSASAPPDLMRLDLAAEGRGHQVGTAVDAASRALDRMRETLLGSGVAPADLASGAITVRPEYDDRGRVAGYLARLTLQAGLRDLGDAGRLLGAVLASGGDAARVDGMRLAHSDPSALQARAREDAWRGARAAAEEYAALAGRALGQVLAVVEGGGDGPAPRGGFELAAMDRFAAVPVEPGASAVSVTVWVRWELG